MKPALLYSWATRDWKANRFSPKILRLLQCKKWTDWGWWLQTPSWMEVDPRVMWTDHLDIPPERSLGGLEGWVVGTIAHSALYLLRQKKFPILCCGLSSKDTLLIHLEIASSRFLSSSLSGRVGILWLSDHLLPTTYFLTLHIPGTQLTVGQRTFAKKWPFKNQWEPKRICSSRTKTVFQNYLCLHCLVGFRDCKFLNKPRFAGIVKALETRTPELVKLF